MLSYRNIVVLLALLVIKAEGTPHQPESHPFYCEDCPQFVATQNHVHTSAGVPTNLTCGVTNVGSWQVSWIRRKDLHVLTTGSHLYTSDKRFQIHHTANSPYWTLEFLDPSPSDAGTYECQISTQPKEFKPFNISVSVAEASIVNGDEIYMQTGSDINITCIISGNTFHPSVTWIHTPPDQYNTSSEQINLGGRGGVQMVTDKKAANSWLLVKNATRQDAGEYTCIPDYAVPATTIVHIIDDDRPAAMQPDPISSSAQTSLCVLVMVITKLLIILR